MIKYLVFYAFWGSFFLGIQTEKSESEKMNLKGKVNIIYENIDFTLDTISLGQFAKHSTEYVYNNSGYQTKVDVFLPDFDTSHGQISESFYDAQGNKIKEIGYNALDTNTIITYTYDSQNELINRKTLNSLDSFHRRPGIYATYKYEAGKIKEVYEFTLEGTPVQKTFLEYRKDGIITKNTYDIVGKSSRLAWQKITTPDHTEDYIFDDKGKVIRKEVVFFDSVGNYILNSKYPDNTVTKRNITYDLNRNIIKIDTKYTQGNNQKDYTEKYKYEYDKVGNWIKQTYYLDDTLHQITTRKIIYY